VTPDEAVRAYDIETGSALWETDVEDLLPPDSGAGYSETRGGNPVAPWHGAETNDQGIFRYGVLS